MRTENIEWKKFVPDAEKDLKKLLIIWQLEFDIHPARAYELLLVTFFNKTLEIRVSKPKYYKATLETLILPLFHILTSQNPEEAIKIVLEDLLDDTTN